MWLAGAAGESHLPRLPIAQDNVVMEAKPPKADPRKRARICANVWTIVGGVTGYSATVAVVWLVCERLVRPDMQTDFGRELFGVLAGYPLVLFGVLAPVGCLIGSWVGYRLAIRSLQPHNPPT